MAIAGCVKNARRSGLWSPKSSPACPRFAHTGAYLFVISLVAPLLTSFVRDNHTEWDDMKVGMMLPSGTIWKCPTAGCQFQYELPRDLIALS